MSPSVESVEANKSELRRRWKDVLESGFARDPKRNQKISGLVANRPEFQRAARIGLFAPLNWEPDLLSLWRLRPEACAFPRVIKGTRYMEFYRVRAETELAAGYAGILEPREENTQRVAAWEKSDLILVPGYYFDARGGRLGSGKGYYDRYLAGKPATLWGICWNEQRLSGEAVPQDGYDVRVAAVCTEAGFFPS